MSGPVVGFECELPCDACVEAEICTGATHTAPKSNSDDEDDAQAVTALLCDIVDKAALAQRLTAVQLASMINDL